MTKNRTIFITTEYIKLGQLIKLLGLINNGSEAKFFLFNNEIKVNGNPEERRGRKIYPGYEVVINSTEVYKIEEKK